MTRLALVLSAAVLGTGCIVVHDDPPPCGRTVTVDWAFGTPDGATVGCSSSNALIDSVDVWVDDVYVATFDCAAGQGTVTVPPGAHLFTVEGFEGSSLVNRDELTVDSTACGGQLVPLRPAEGRVNLDYGTTSAPPCANGPCYLWFAVRDDIASARIGQTVLAALVNASTVPTLYPYPNDVVFNLPVGNFTVLWMDIVSGGLGERFSCTTPGFSVFPGSLVGEQQLVPASPVLLQTSCSL